MGDVVQVFLESAGSPEGDFLVSGVQAAVQRRLAAVWNELEERQQRGELVKGACGRACVCSSPSGLGLGCGGGGGSCVSCSVFCGMQQLQQQQ